MFIQTQAQRDWARRAFWTDAQQQPQKTIKPTKRKRSDAAAVELVRQYRAKGLMLTRREARALIAIKRSQPWFGK